MPSKRAAPPLSSSAAVQPHKRQKAKQTRMDEWSRLIPPEPEDQQPTASVLDSKSDSSSSTSAPNSIEIPIVEEHQDETASNAATVEALPPVTHNGVEDIKKEPSVLDQ